MRIATVILIYGKSPNLEECLASLKSAKHPGIDNKIIVVDNSKDNTGYSGRNNRGICQALAGGAEAVLILNDDTKIDKSFISAMVKALSDKEAGLIAPKIYFYPGFEFHKDRYKPKELGKVIWYAGGMIDWDNCLGVHRGVDEIDAGQYQRKEETGFATGCAVLIRREVFEKSGYITKNIFFILKTLIFRLGLQEQDLKLFISLSGCMA